MKKFLMNLAAIAVLAFSSLAWGGTNQGAGTSSVPVEDVWGNTATVAGLVNNALEGVLMDKNTVGSMTERVSDALTKAGMPAGRTLQTSILKGLGDALTALDGVFTTATAISKANDAVQANDKAAYQKAVAEFIVSMTAKIVGVAVSTTVLSAGTIASWGVGTVPSFILSGLAGVASEKVTKVLMEKFVQEYIEELVGAYWDWLHGKKPGVSADDLEQLDDGKGNGDKGHGGRDSGYQKPQGIKAHQWGSK